MYYLLLLSSVIKSLELNLTNLAIFIVNNEIFDTEIFCIIVTHSITYCRIGLYNKNIESKMNYFQPLLFVENSHTHH